MKIFNEEQTKKFFQLKRSLTVWGRTCYIYHFDYISKIGYRRAPRAARPVPSRTTGDHVPFRLVPPKIMSRPAKLCDTRFLRYTRSGIYTTPVPKGLIIILQILRRKRKKCLSMNSLDYSSTLYFFLTTVIHSFYSMTEIDTDKQYIYIYMHVTQTVCYSWYESIKHYPSWST
jgi:hypothetical protein